MRDVEISGARATLAKLHQEFSRLVEFQNARAGTDVSFRNEDIAIGSGHHVVGLIEVAGFTGSAGFAESHEKCALRAELQNLLPLCCLWRGSDGNSGSARRP